MIAAHVRRSCQQTPRRQLQHATMRPGALDKLAGNFERSLQRTTGNLLYQPVAGRRQFIGA
jgi:hypothetical protein